MVSTLDSRWDLNIFLLFQHKELKINYLSFFVHLVKNLAKINNLILGNRIHCLQVRLICLFHLNLVRDMGLESSRYSRIQIAMTTGSDPGSYDWGGGWGCVVS